MIKEQRAESKEQRAKSKESGEVKGIFDLTGRKVNEITVPGIYIIDGKKTLVK